MAKLRTTEDQLALLRTLRADPHLPQTVPALEALLKMPRLHGIVLKSIASLAEQINAKTLAPQLAKAALSLTSDDAAKRDPGCEAKIAILKTLLAWDEGTPELFLTLSTYRQMTPTFGDPIDVAAELRGLSALGLAITRPPDAILRLVDLLADKEKTTRAYAAMAVGNWPGPESLPLLRLQILRGDDDPEAFAELLAALLRHDPAQLDFVAQFLTDPTLESAALALGQSKLPAALTPLTNAYSLHRRSSSATTLLMSISLLRSEEAIAWLLTQLAASTQNEKQSLTLLDALRIHRTDPKILAKIETVVKSHPALLPAFNEVFK